MPTEETVSGNGGPSHPPTDLGRPVRVCPPLKLSEALSTRRSKLGANSHVFYLTVTLAIETHFPGRGFLG